MPNEISGIMPASVHSRGRENQVQIFIKEKDGEFLIVGVRRDHDIYFLGAEGKLPEACEEAKKLARKIGVSEDDIHVLGTKLTRFHLT